MQVGDVVHPKNSPTLVGKIISFQAKSGTVLVDFGDKLKYYTPWNLKIGDQND